jgi:hypothetical protein
MAQPSRRFVLMSVDGLPKNHLCKECRERKNNASSTNNIMIGNNAKQSIIKSEMDDTLKRSDLSTEQKLTQYQQLQEEYFNKLPEKRKREEAEKRMEEKKQREFRKPQHIIATAMAFFKKAYSEKAAGLGQFLMDDKRIGDSVQWNNFGEVIIDGHLIRGSNLQALMDDVLRKRASVKPVGYLQFAEVLKRKNLPSNVVGETTGVYKVSEFSEDKQSTQVHLQNQQQNEEIEEEEDSEPEAADEKVSSGNVSSIRPEAGLLTPAVVKHKTNLDQQAHYSPLGFRYKSEWEPWRYK